MIKQLPWVETQKNRWTASLGDFGLYCIGPVDPVEYFVQYFPEEFPVYVGGPFRSAEAAKGCAQNDWERKLSKFLE